MHTNYKITETPNYEVAIATDGKKGYFEHHELGDEHGGGLWFDDGALRDYDGVPYLPREVSIELEKRGVDISYLSEEL
jgi:hypothetical protein